MPERQFPILKVEIHLLADRRSFIQIVQNMRWLLVKKEVNRHGDLCLAAFISKLYTPSLAH
eukprot:scaffold30130_cov58-Attheya_sp.AAC.5